MKGSTEEKGGLNIGDSTVNSVASKKHKVPIWAIVLGCIGVVVLLALLGTRIYYNSHWYAGTWIGDNDVSGMTVKESQELIAKDYTDYQLEIKGRDDGSLTLTKTDVDYSVNTDDAVQDQFDSQHSKFSFASLFKKKTVTITPEVSYDDAKVKSFLSTSEIFTGSDSYEITKPANAKVTYSEDTHCCIIKEEVIGNKLIKSKFTEAVESALNAGAESMDLSDADTYPDVYKAPAITSDNEELQTELNAWNTAVVRWVTWKIADGVKEKATPDDIYKWCSYKDGKITYDKQVMRDWMEKICLKYKTLGGKRTFKNHNGKKITVSGGDYGWQLDYETMVSQLTKGVNKDIDSSLQSAYIDDPSSANQKALTISNKATYLGTAYNQDFDNKMNDWDKKNFTEVCLSEQMVYVWRKGKVVFSCPTISGLPVADRKTKTGAYFIKEHKASNVLRGANYATPVTYWVRIMWTGTGFHSASWQPWSSWSSSLYKTRGSHGCLNLSPANAKSIFDLTKYKEMVFIY